MGMGWHGMGMGIVFAAGNNYLAGIRRMQASMMAQRLFLA